MKKYPKKWRVMVMVLLCLFLIGTMSAAFSGCSARKDANSENVQPSGADETWVLVRLPDGNTIHTRVTRYQRYGDGIAIYTENRMYFTSLHNVCIIKDLE